jgi:ribosomal protein L11 methylase PrmA
VPYRIDVSLARSRPRGGPPSGPPSGTPSGPHSDPPDGAPDGRRGDARHEALDEALDRLVDLGALDVEVVDGVLAAIVPDGVSPQAIARELGVARVAVSPAVGRDDGSVWILGAPAVRVGRLHIAPPGVSAARDAIRLTDSAAFGSGLHPTTALCIEALDAAVASETPASLLDVGTGSGVLALVALRLGVPRVVGLDTDAEALRVAAEHARLNSAGVNSVGFNSVGFNSVGFNSVGFNSVAFNGDGDRLRLVLGGPDAVDGAWPLVVANVLAAPLIEMAPVLVRRVGHRGRLILSGVPRGVAPDVEQTYVRLGMRTVGSETRAGWTALVVQASW